MPAGSNPRAEQYWSRPLFGPIQFREFRKLNALSRQPKNAKVEADELQAKARAKKEKRKKS
jgi:hypothetical protein